MKKYVLLTMVLVLILALSACGCKHENWIAADCVTPMTCSECGETMGEPLGHRWTEANCDAPKTCSLCAQTEGTALEHNWIEATCTLPRSCQSCRLTEGEPLGHSWADATTEAPKTCTACGKTEGERIITDSRFTTASTHQLYGKWRAEITENIPEMEIDLTIITGFEFFNDGTMKISAEIKDSEAFLETMIRFSLEMFYEQMAAEGYSKEAADKYLREETGMTAEEYYTDVYTTIDLNSILGMTNNITYVYYVDGETLYYGISWNTEMSGDQFAVEDGVLYMYGYGETLVPTPFYKVEENTEM